MGVLQEVSCGDILYQYISDMAPIHSGVTGTVAISKLSGRVFTCISGYDWVAYLKSNLYGSSYVNNNTAETVDLSTSPVEGWTNMSALSFTLGPSSGFTLVNNYELRPNEDTYGIFRCNMAITFLNKSARASAYSAGVSKNNFVPPYYFGGGFGTVGSLDDRCSFISPIIFTLDGRTTDYLGGANNQTYQENSTARTARQHVVIDAAMIEEPITLNEKWNSGTESTNGWVMVNDTTNKWVIGTASTRNGPYSLYISNNSGLTNTYTNTVSQVSHIYIDLEFPNNLNITTTVDLSFYWKGTAESGSDFTKVYFTPTSITPVAGTEINSTYLVSRELSNQNSFTAETISVSATDALNGKTGRLIFSWKNNNNSVGSTGTTIDDIRFGFYINIYNDYGAEVFNEDFESNSFSTNGWTLAPDPGDNIWSGFTAENNTFTGTSAAYITTIASAGASPTYATDGTTSVSHFWRNFSFPSGITKCYLTFDWKCGGSNLDVASVNIEGTGTTVTGGTQLTTTKATAGGNGRIGGDVVTGAFAAFYFSDADVNWRKEVIDLSSWIGQNKKIVFSWFNTAASDSPPGFIVDNIRIYQK